MILEKDTTILLKKSFLEYVGYEDIWDNKAIMNGELKLISELKILPPKEQEEIINNHEKASEMFVFPCNVILLNDIIIFDTFDNTALVSIKRFGGKVLDIASAATGAALGPIAAGISLAPIVAAKELKNRLGNESQELESFLVKHNKELSEMAYITSSKCKMIELTEAKKSVFGREKRISITIKIHGVSNVFGVDKDEVIRTIVNGKTSDVMKTLSNNGFKEDKIRTMTDSLDNL